MLSNLSAVSRQRNASQSFISKTNSLLTGFWRYSPRMVLSVTGIPDSRATCGQYARKKKLAFCQPPTTNLSIKRLFRYSLKVGRRRYSSQRPFHIVFENPDLAGCYVTIVLVNRHTVDLRSAVTVSAKALSGIKYLSAHACRYERQLIAHIR